MKKLDPENGIGDKTVGRFSSQKSRGFGDTVKKITDKLKIPQCGACSKRQKKLNRLIPYGKKDKKEK